MAHSGHRLTGKEHDDGELLELVLEDPEIHREERRERADLRAPSGEAPRSEGGGGRSVSEPSRAAKQHLYARNTLSVVARGWGAYRGRQ